MLTRRTQKLFYVGLPLKLRYTLLEKNRWQLYASGGIGLDIPVRGKETTQYLYIGPYQPERGDSLILPTTHARVKAPWQWSVNMGAGVQYQLLPHVNAYFEPRLQYYIPTGNPVETYARSIHSTSRCPSASDLHGNPCSLLAISGLYE